MYLVTGAAGFVGNGIVQDLRSRGNEVIGAVRTGAGDGQVNAGNIDGSTQWSALLQDVSIVVHAAAHVHAGSDSDGEDRSLHWQVNFEGTRRLAKECAATGVRRLVFLSTIKVNGERTGVEDGPEYFTAFDSPAPAGAYAESKFAAEQAILEVADKTDLEVVVIRPPLVYGHGVRANFRMLISLVESGLPLPLAAIANSRSLVSLDNLVSLCVACSSDSRAAGEVFLVSDDRDLSTPELIRMIAEAMGRQARLFPVPPRLLELMAYPLGMGSSVRRLTESLRVSIEHTRQRLDWSPPVTVEQGLRATVSNQ